MTYFITLNTKISESIKKKEKANTKLVSYEKKNFVNLFLYILGKNKTVKIVEFQIF